MKYCEYDLCRESLPSRIAVLIRKVICNRWIYVFKMPSYPLSNVWLINIRWLYMDLVINSQSLDLNREGCILHD